MAGSAVACGGCYRVLGPNLSACSDSLTPTPSLCRLSADAGPSRVTATPAAAQSAPLAPRAPPCLARTCRLGRRGAPTPTGAMHVPAPGHTTSRTPATRLPASTCWSVGLPTAGVRKIAWRMLAPPPPALVMLATPPVMAARRVRTVRTDSARWPLHDRAVWCWYWAGRWPCSTTVTDEPLPPRFPVLCVCVYRTHNCTGHNTTWAPCHRRCMCTACTTGTDTCSGIAASTGCSYTPGSYVCTCGAGYKVVGSGGTGGNSACAQVRVCGATGTVVQYSRIARHTVQSQA